MSVRMTITVPNDLRRRMEEVIDHANWSAVAARAFEKRVEVIESGVDLSLVYVDLRYAQFLD